MDQLLTLQEVAEYLNVSRETVRRGSLAALQEIIGHASIMTTQRYGRLSDAHVQAEAARIQGRKGTVEGTVG